jgi:hypothetical protein
MRMSTRSHDGADHRAERHRKESGGKRDARPHHDAAEDVTAEGIHAEPVFGGRPGIQRIIIEIIFGIERHQVLRQDRHQHQQQHEYPSRNPGMLPAKLAPEFAPWRAHLGGGSSHALCCFDGCHFSSTCSG